jgi:hypothetical protein
VYDNPEISQDVYESHLFEEDMYGRRVRQRALCISYLNKLDKEFTVDKNASTNDD